jgi:hypothetical protein
MVYCFSPCTCGTTPIVSLYILLYTAPKKNDEQLLTVSFLPQKAFQQGNHALYKGYLVSSLYYEGYRDCQLGCVLISHPILSFKILLLLRIDIDPGLVYSYSAL